MLFFLSMLLIFVSSASQNLSGLHGVVVVVAGTAAASPPMLRVSARGRDVGGIRGRENVTAGPVFGGEALGAA